MNGMMSKWAVVTAMGLLLGGAAFGQKDGGQKRAKDIFYRPDPPAAQQPAPLGLNYKILLKRGDMVGFVPEGYQFKSGDQFRIYFQSNSEGYAYIFNRGTSGQGSVLFPDPRINGGQNKIPAYTEYVVPAAGWFEFDAKPGIEELFVFFSAKPLAQLDRPVQQRTIEQTFWQQTVTTMIERRSESIKSGKTKDIVYVEGAESVTPAVAGNPPPAQPAPQPQPQPNPGGGPVTINGCASYYVATQTQEPEGFLIHTIKLNHN